MFRCGLHNPAYLGCRRAFFRVDVSNGERSSRCLSLPVPQAIATGDRVVPVPSNRKVSNSSGPVHSGDSWNADRETNSTAHFIDSGDAIDDEHQAGEEAAWDWGSMLCSHLLLGLPIATSAGFVGVLGDRPEVSQNFTGVVEALAILTAIVFVHECGHFLAARLQNIHITEFSIGFGPSLLRYQGRKVKYSLRAIPLGGYVSFPDDASNNPYPADDPDLFQNRSIPERALVISAGVLANLAFAFSILFAQVSVVGVTDHIYQPGVRIPAVKRQSVAEYSGLEPGDIIISVNDEPILAGPGAVSDVVNTINDQAGQRIALLVNRGGKTIPISVTPEVGLDGKGVIGLQLTSNSSTYRARASNFFQATVLASNELSRMCTSLLSALKKLVTNFEAAKGDVSGPLAVMAVGAEVAKVDASQLFQFAAMVNVNLAVVNILPIPALDGGFLALLFLEALRGGKKLPEGVESGVMASGWLLLMTLGCALIVRDTMNLGILHSVL